MHHRSHATAPRTSPRPTRARPPHHRVSQLALLTLLSAALWACAPPPSEGPGAPPGAGARPPAPPEPAPVALPEPLETPAETPPGLPPAPPGPASVNLPDASAQDSAAAAEAGAEMGAAGAVATVSADDGTPPEVHLPDDVDAAFETCTYTIYDWSVTKGRAVNRRRVEKPYAAVTDEERSPDDPRCTLCSEDQVLIDLAEYGWTALGSVEVCRFYEAKMRAALREIAADGSFELVSIRGYQAGYTRGHVVDGLRTELSNHSFGTAVDINARQNGLYGNCAMRGEVTVEALRRCRLYSGGHWRPDRDPRRTVVRGGVVYRAFTDFWRWGGEIGGATKDMMHFSLTGY